MTTDAQSVFSENCVASMYNVGASACRYVYMFTVMFQILFMAVVLYAPALAFEAGALNKCCHPHDVEES